MKLAAAALCCLAARAEPDLPAVATPAGAEELALPLPVFRIHASDADNPFQAVFVDLSDPGRPELNVIWRDEDNPIPLFDVVYDADRWWGLFHLSTSWPFFEWDPASTGGHRIADVETITYQMTPAGGLSTLEFDSTYAGDQPWDVVFALHIDATLPLGAFETVEGRPVVYVNTWNHLFSNENGNPGMPLVELSDVPVYKGTREEIEAFYEAVWADYGLPW